MDDKYTYIYIYIIYLNKYIYIYIGTWACSKYAYTMRGWLSVCGCVHVCVWRIAVTTELSIEIIENSRF